MIPARSKQELGRYFASMKPKMIETLHRSWDDMLYSLPLGIDTNSAIKLELVYFEVCFCGSIFSRVVVAVAVLSY